MSNRRRPRNPLTEATALPTDRIGVEWTDEPAADYPPRLLDFIAEHASEAGRMNVWQCEQCGANVLYYDRHPGVTPFMVSHNTLGNPDCPGVCKSHFYSGLDAAVVRETQGPPTHEWYRPSAKKLRHESPAVRDHVMQGGLLVREATP